MLQIQLENEESQRKQQAEAMKRISHEKEELRVAMEMHAKREEERKALLRSM